MPESLAIGPNELAWLEQTLHLSDFLPISSVEELKGQLPTAELLAYASGEDLVREGDEGADVFLLYEGRAVVRRKAWLGSKKLGELSAGAVFGEVAFLGQGARSATVRAEGAAKAFRFGGEDMRRMLEREPRLAQRVAALAKERLKSLRG